MPGQYRDLALGRSAADGARHAPGSHRRPAGLPGGAHAAQRVRHPVEPGGRAGGSRPLTGVGSDVLVVGGGIIGCATAYYLAQAGASVTLLER
ncbi:MAG: FAD-dependent oxidoreductase, partial [Chloroflexi bacterium]|nr:FAD-dependent oxidoreductase [Chloroflexota bacterium]